LIAAFDRKMNPPLSDEENPTLNAVLKDWYDEKKGTMQPTPEPPNSIRPAGE